MPQPIVKKPPEGALKRLDAIETTIGQVITAVNKAMTELTQKQNGIVEALEAAIEIVGIQEVQQKILQRQADAEQARMDAAKQWVSERVAAGELLPAAAVTPTSFVVGEETDDEGKKVGAGYVQASVSRFDDRIKNPLLGQVVGFVLTTPDKTNFKILEIYEPGTPVQAAAAVPQTETSATVAPQNELDTLEEELAPSDATSVGG